MAQQPQQAPPQPEAGPSTSYHPPVAPSIPAPNLQAIILRLTHAIHDIDAFQNLLASGAQSGTMPTWDTILERYSLLLSRTQALSTFLARPPPQPSTPHPTEQPSTDPILSKYLVHSLNPLPEPGTEKGDQVNPIARDIFEWVLSTLPNPALVAAESELLVTDGGGPEGWKSLDELKGLSDVQLNKLSRELRDRLGRESQRAEVMREEIDRKDGEMDWEMRILDDTAEEEGSAAGQKEEKEAAKDDDLFGEDDIVMVDPPDGTSSKKQVAPKAVEKDPQEGWKLADYLAYMDTGRMPRATLGS